VVVGELIGSEGGGEDIGERCDCFFDRGFDRRERKGMRNVMEKGVWRSVILSYRYLRRVFLNGPMGDDALFCSVWVLVVQIPSLGLWPKLFQLF